MSLLPPASSAFTTRAPPGKGLGQWWNPSRWTTTRLAIFFWHICHSRWIYMDIICNPKKKAEIQHLTNLANHITTSQPTLTRFKVIWCWSYIEWVILLLITALPTCRCHAPIFSAPAYHLESMRSAPALRQSPDFEENKKSQFCPSIILVG